MCYINYVTGIRPCSLNQNQKVGDECYNTLISVTDWLIGDFIIQTLLETHSLCYFSKIDGKINIAEIEKVWPVAILFLNTTFVINIEYIITD